jgi:hypothetical protein
MSDYLGKDMRKVKKDENEDKDKEKEIKSESQLI